MNKNKYSVSLLVGVLAGIVLTAAHLTLTTGSLIKDKYQYFDRFISVFDMARDKLKMSTEGVHQQFARDLNTFSIERDVDLNQLYMDKKINDADMITLATLAKFYEPKFSYIAKVNNMGLSYLSFNAEELFYGVNLKEDKSFKEQIKCSESNYCLFLYENSQRGFKGYTYDMFENAAEKTAIFTISAPVINRGERIGSLILDMPVNKFFDEQVYFNKTYATGKNIYTISSSSIPFLNTHKDYVIDNVNVLRVQVSYLQVWLSKIGLFLLYTVIAFCLMLLSLNKKEYIALVEDVKEKAKSPQETFYDDMKKTYCSSILASEYLKEIVNRYEHNSLILVKYDVEEAKANEILNQADQHIVYILNSFVRSTDFIIRYSEDELLILLPKCSTENATKIVHKMFFNLGEQTYSEMQLKVKAYRVISSLESTAVIDRVIGISQQEIAKEIAEER